MKEILWLEQFVDKIETKHGVTVEEVEQVLHGKRKVRRVRRGHVKGEDVYLTLGQTLDGRYLAIFYIQKRDNQILPISCP